MSEDEEEKSTLDAIEDNIFKGFTASTREHYSRVIADFYAMATQEEGEEYEKEFSLKVEPDFLGEVPKDSMNPPDFGFYLSIPKLYEVFALLMAIPEEDLTYDSVHMLKIRLLYYFSEQIFNAEFIDMATVDKMVEEASRIEEKENKPVLH